VTFFTFLLALAALIVAATSRSQIQALTQQLKLLEGELRRLRARPAPEAGASEAPPAVAGSADLTAPPPVLRPVTREAALAAGEVAPSVPASPPPSPPPLPTAPGPAAVPARPAAPKISFEERIGARLPVWIGALALALAGAFLVKYSFDRGWLSPTVRVILGVAFGVVLLAAGERLRRTVSTARIAQGLSAAGIADLFACFLAGVQLYGLIPPWAGFALMALTTAVAVVLSLRQGPMVALIGLFGGFVTPYLIRTGDPNAPGLFAYLLLLQAGLLAVAWRRGWSLIAALSVSGGLLWVVVWLAGPFTPPDGVWLGLFLLLSSAGVAVAVLRRPAADGGAAPGLAQAAPLLWAGLALANLALGFVLYRTEYSATEWVFFGLLTAGILVLGRAEPAFEGLAWLAAGAAAALLAAWQPAALALQPEATALPATAELPRFLATALALELLFGLGACAAAFAAVSIRGERRPPPHPGRWTALAGASVLAFFLIAWSAAEGGLAGFPWGAAALVHGLALVAGTALILRAARRAEEPEATARRAPAAGLAAAATAFVSLAVPLELERAWLTVAWALEVPALLWLAGRFRLPVLTVLARIAAVAVAVRLLLNPELLSYPIGDGLLVNWLVYGYGIPLLAFAAGSRLARRQADPRTAAGLEVGALALAVALVSLEIGQAFHPGAPGSGPVSLTWWATLTVAWLLLAWAALALSERLAVPPAGSAGSAGAPLRSLALGGRVLGLLALAAVVLGQGLVLNPLWSHQAVGETPVLNLLFWDYGVPIALLFVLAGWLLRAAPERSRSWWMARGLGISGLALLFLLVTLEVRQLFHGTFLDLGTTGAAERYSYSAAWIVFGTVLLGLGIVRRGRILRYAALAVMTVAVCKVFLYDTANLSDLYRVFSFLGLGASLLLLAWLYQRFVFREVPPEPAAPASQEEAG
jgi:uncharacterized membrane protein